MVEATDLARFVVVGYEDTAAGRAALARALSEAARRHIPLRLVLVYRSSDLQRAERAYDRALAFARRHADVAVTGALISGDPASVLVAESSGAELLVVGSGHPDSEAELALDSVSGLVAEDADCTVLVVREEPPAPSDPSSRRRSRRRTVVGVADSDTADAALRFGFDEAHMNGLELDMIQCVPSGADSSVDTVESVRRVHRLYERVAELRKKHPDVQVVAQTSEEDPQRVLIRESRTAELLVLGAGFHGLHSLGRRMLLDAPCSVAFARDPIPA